MQLFNLDSQGEFTEKPKNIDSTKNQKRTIWKTTEFGYKCFCLNARSIVNKRNELNIIVEDINPHIIGITESWATTDILDAKLGMTGCEMIRKDRTGEEGEVELKKREGLQNIELHGVSPEGRMSY